ncbi:elongation of very long chain fatty acids protein 6-like isoform X2 [Carassius auratus]|uniref:Elongation of very long chain fatty acids protein n=1 Tax=Carassius auratus TaxID=7957 RepID=A0A6P6P0H2_CARAU|nr:elongation of very long chain fatty acids protein 6-like isoform X2 [Carassius auratus]
MSVLALQEYEFERQFNEDEAIRWMQENWKKSFLFSALYAACILGGRHVMKQREKFELRKPLVLWSLTLAAFRLMVCIIARKKSHFLVPSYFIKTCIYGTQEACIYIFILSLHLNMSSNLTI